MLPRRKMLWASAPRLPAACRSIITERQTPIATEGAVWAVWFAETKMSCCMERTGRSTALEGGGRDGLGLIRSSVPLIGKGDGCSCSSLIRMQKNATRPVLHTPQREGRTCPRIASVPQTRRMTCSFSSSITMDGQKGGMNG